MAPRECCAALRRFATEIRVNMLLEFGELGFGHVGGSLSVADVLAVLYGKVMRIDPKNPRDPARDQLVLSKGHAGPALYATLALKGYFPMENLKTLNRDNTTLPSHCDRNKTVGVDMSTGSLGQGMSSAIGIALAGKLRGDGSRAYLILGDGECDEGQVWEGALFAAHHKVANLTAFIDNNRQQLDGYTKDICDLGDIRRKFEDFGWLALEVDGHDVEAVLGAVEQGHAQTEKPVMIILDTKKGMGADFAMNIMGNHHMEVTKDQINAAVAALTATLEGK